MNEQDLITRNKDLYPDDEITGGERHTLTVKARTPAELQRG